MVRFTRCCFLDFILTSLFRIVILCYIPLSMIACFKPSCTCTDVHAHYPLPTHNGCVNVFRCHFLHEQRFAEVNSYSSSNDHRNYSQVFVTYLISSPVLTPRANPQSPILTPPSSCSPGDFRERLMRNVLMNSVTYANSNSNSEDRIGLLVKKMR